MNRIENLRRHILNNQKSDPSGGIHYLPITLANYFGLQEDHVKQVLAEMEDEGLTGHRPAAAAEYCGPISIIGIR